MKKFVPLFAIALLVGACIQGQGQKQTGGTLLGAGLGALAGSQFGSGRGQLVAVALGALGGAYLGSEIGKSLDNADRMALGQSTNRALESAPSGQAVSWSNPDSGNYGSIVPEPAVRQSNGSYCREYQQTIVVGGQTEKAHGRACRQPDGTWKIVQ